MAGPWAGDTDRCHHVLLPSECRAPQPGRCGQKCYEDGQVLEPTDAECRPPPWTTPWPRNPRGAAAAAATAVAGTVSAPDALSPSQRHSLWFESKARIAERYTGISSGSRRGTGVESSAQTAPRWKRPWKSVSHQRRSESVDSEVRDTCLRKTTRSADGGASLFPTCQMHALRRVPLSVATRLRQPRCLRGLGRATHGQNGRRSLRRNGARSGHLGLTAGCTVLYSHTVSILL